MQVAHFLDFKSSLHGNWFTISLPEHEAMVLTIQAFGNLLALVTSLQCHSEANWQSHETFSQVFSLGTCNMSAIHAIFQLTEPQGNQRQHCDLSGKSFCGSNSILTTSITVNTQLGHTSDQ